MHLDDLNASLIKLDRKVNLQFTSFFCLLWLYSLVKLKATQIDTFQLMEKPEKNTKTTDCYLVLERS